MKALVFTRSSLRIEEMDKPVPANGEALVHVKLAGICNTDLEIVKGYMDFSGVLGHEFTGLVEEAGDENLIGKRIVGEINAGCGVCELCAKGDPRHCRNRTVLGISNRNGAFAEYLTLPESNLSVLPDAIEDEEGVLVEPLAAAFQITEQVKIEKNHRVLIIGDGKLGILVCLALSSIVSDIFLSGHHLERNRSLLPLIKHLDLSEDIGESASYDIVIEASGSPEGFADAIRFVKPTGIIVLKSTYHGVTSLDGAKIVINEIRIIGSRCGRFKLAIDALESGRIKIPAGYFSGRYSLNKAMDAFEYAGQKGILKVLIRP